MSPSLIEEPIQSAIALKIDETSPQTPNPALLHRSLRTRPYDVASANGIQLYLSSGKTIIDACGGAAVACIGHGNQEVIAAVTAQMQKVSYVHTLSYTTQSAEKLATFLLQDNPYGFEKVYFVSSGSEATESALKIARQYFFEKGETQRTRFVTRRQGYHGNTIGAMSISSYVGRKVPYGGIMPDNVSHVTPAYAYQFQRSSETSEQFVQRLLTELEDEFLRVGPSNIIAFVGEPVVGATAGCVVSPKGYFPGVRQLCDRYGILLILDEVMCGSGRTGTFFAFEQDKVVPDILTLGKGLGGGYTPIAGVLINKRVIDVLREGSSAFNHGHTYQAHPVSCAAALAVQTIVRREKLVESCAKRGQYLEQALQRTFGNCKYVGDIRGRGLFWAIEFVKNKITKESLLPSIGFGFKVQQTAWDLGVAVYPGSGTVDGTRGDHVLLAPPFNVTEVELDLIVNTVKQAYDICEEDVDLFGSKI